MTWEVLAACNVLAACVLVTVFFVTLITAWPVIWVTLAAVAYVALLFVTVSIVSGEKSHEG